jgi:hypothetical protein
MSAVKASVFVIEAKYSRPVRNWIESVKDFLKDNNAFNEETAYDTGLYLEDVLETVTLQYVICITPNLAHHNEDIRQAVSLLFVNLAGVFDEQWRDDDNIKSLLAQISAANGAFGQQLKICVVNSLDLVVRYHFYLYIYIYIFIFIYLFTYLTISLLMYLLFCLF